MTLLAPLWLVVGALALVVIVLHVRKRRLVDVPSLLLWRRLDMASVPRPKITPPKVTILLILQLLIVLLSALALARPFLGVLTTPEHRIYLVDASGSMRATDVAPSRFDAAMAELEQRVAANPTDGSRVSVIEVGADPIVRVARQTAPSGMLPILAAMAAGDGAADWAAAGALVPSVLHDGERSRVIVLTDGTDLGAAAAEEAIGLPVERVVFASQEPKNRGLAAEVAPIDLAAGTWRISGSVLRGTPGETVAIAVRFLPGNDGTFLDWTEIAVPIGNGEATSFTFGLDLPGAGALRLAVPDDDGPADNTVQFVLRSEPRAARVLYVGASGPALTRALQALDGVELYATAALPDAEEAFDLVIADGVDLDRSPATNVLWVGAARGPMEEPPRSATNVEASAWRSDHPLSAGIDWATLPAGAAYLAAALPGSEAIVSAGDRALIAARTTASGREVRLALALDEFRWVDQAGFPVFIRNLIDWLGVDIGGVSQSCTAGLACPVEARLLSGPVRLFGEEGVAPEATGRVGALVPSGFRPDRAGLHRIGTGEGAAILAVNAPADESRLTPVLDDVGSPSLGALLQQEIWWWLLAVVLLLLLLEGWLAGRGSERFLHRNALSSANPLAGRHRLLLALRLGAIVLTIAALAGFPIPTREQAEDLVLVAAIDRPADAGLTTADTARVAGLDLANARDGARLGLVALGAPGTVAADLGPLASTQPILPQSVVPGANLEAALELAAAMLPADRLGRIVVAANGTETAGELGDALAVLNDRRLEVDVHPVAALPPGEVLVASVTAPARVRAGDSFPLIATILSERGGPARIAISRDGAAIVERDVELLAGANPVEVTIPETGSGRAVFEVAIAAEGDVYPENNRSGVIVETAPAPRIAVITPDLSWGQFFADALAVQNLGADVLLPAEAPFDLTGWLAYDAVVMMNMPALDLHSIQQGLLELAVEVHGRGLVILGGENSFGPGGYYDTAFERMSPLSSRTPRDAPHAAITFVIDRSGSMQAAAGGGSRLDIAKAATVRAIELLEEDTDVGVVVFDSRSEVIVALQPKSEAVAAIGAIGGIQAGGGTALHPALLQAIAQLEGSDAAVRHIVVMTDGLSEPGDFYAALQRARGSRITISTVAIGQGADEALLRQIANIGGGAYSPARDFAALPSILAREALLLAGSPVRNRASPVSWLDREAGFVANLPDALPAIRTYVVTTAKPEADLHLAVTDADGTVAPLLASWRYGAGQVLAFTGQAAGPGARDLMAFPDYPRLWAQAVRHLLPETEGAGLHVSLERAGDEILITADLLDGAEAPIAGRAVMAALALEGAGNGPSVPLVETSPGRYQGRAPAAAAGTYSVRAEVDGAVAAAILVSYPARYDFSRADPRRLEGLAAATGGSILPGGEPLFGSAPVWSARPGWWLWLMIALSLFTLDLTIRHAPALLGLARRAARPRVELPQAAARPIVQV